MLLSRPSKLLHGGVPNWHYFSLFKSNHQSHYKIMRLAKTDEDNGNIEYSINGNSRRNEKTTRG